jgi:uncharacterized SAM-binding protein YcdF (DUF218 family)
MTRSALARVVAALALLAVILGAFDSAARWLAAPAVDREPAADSADLIVALGGGFGEREARAADLYLKGVAARVLLTGFTEGTDEARAASLAWPSRLLVERGVPREAILIDTRSTSTWTEARNTLALARAHGWRRVIVVTDPPHLRRVKWAWDRVAAPGDAELVLVSSAPDWWRPNGWWRDERSAVFTFNELLKLLFYALRREAPAT